MTLLKPARRRRLTAIAMALLASVSAPPVHAFEQAAKGISFTLHCAALLLTNTEKHKAVCNPKLYPPDDTPAGTQPSGQTVPVVAPPPVVVAPPPPPPPAPEPEQPDEPEEPQCNCGPCLPEEPDPDCVQGAWLFGQTIAVVASLDVRVAEVCGGCFEPQ